MNVFVNAIILQPYGIVVFTVFLRQTTVISAATFEYKYCNLICVTYHSSLAVVKRRDAGCNYGNFTYSLCMLNCCTAKLAFLNTSMVTQFCANSLITINCN